MHRKDSLPRVGCGVNQIHGSETRAYPRTMVATSSKRKTGRWERPAISISSAWSLVEAMGVCGKGFNERLGNRWRTLGALFIARAT